MNGALDAMNAGLDRMIFALDSMDFEFEFDFDFNIEFDQGLLSMGDDWATSPDHSERLEVREADLREPTGVLPVDFAKTCSISERACLAAGGEAGASVITLPVDPATAYSVPTPVAPMPANAGGGNKKPPKPPMAVGAPDPGAEDPDGISINLSTAGRTPAESEALNQYALRANGWLRANGPQSIQGTRGVLRRLASGAARQERLRALQAGTPYQGQAGHVPDTAVTGSAQPPAGWLDMPGFSNQIAGGALASRIGQVLTRFTVDGILPG